MTNTDTITIPRDTFARLCEAAVYLERTERWAMYSTDQITVRRYYHWLKVKNEAVAIRDEGKESCQHKQS